MKDIGVLATRVSGGDQKGHGRSVFISAITWTSVPSQQVTTTSVSRSDDRFPGKPGSAGSISVLFHCCPGREPTGPHTLFTHHRTHRARDPGSATQILTTVPASTKMMRHHAITLTWTSSSDDNRGRKLQAYIYPILSVRWRSNFHLKPANEHPEIISSSKIFHSLTAVLRKENLATSSRTIFLFNFNEWPQRLDCDIGPIKKHFLINIFISFENFKNFY